MGKFFDTESVFESARNLIPYPISGKLYDLLKSAVESVDTDMNNWYDNREDAEEALTFGAYLDEESFMGTPTPEEIKEILFWIWNHSVDIEFDGDGSADSALTSMVDNVVSYYFANTVASAYRSEIDK